MAKNVFDDPQLSPTLPSGEVTFGQTLGARYRLDEQLLETDDIALWRGWDEQLSRIVLLYVLPPNHPRTTAVLAAARSASQAVDARFLRVLDALEYGPSEPVSFVVCECVPGYNLQAVLAAGPVGSLAATWLTSEIAKALVPLHAAHLSHGRLSPDSAVITTSGNIKVSGFLLDAVLSPRPEEADWSWEEREAADVSALGQILYASLTGHWPILVENESDYGLPAVRRTIHGITPPSQLRPGVPQILDVICIQILAPQPDNPRLSSAQDVVNALAQVLGPADATEDLAYRVRALAVATEPGDSDALDSTRPTNFANSATSERSEAGAMSRMIAPPPAADTDTILDEYESSQPLELATAEIAATAAPVATPGSDGVTAASATPSASDNTGDTGGTGNLTDSPAPPLFGATKPGTMSDMLRQPLQNMVTKTGKIPPWQLGLGIVLVVAVFFGIRSLFGGDDPAKPSGGVEVKVSIASAVSFDPKADGGSGDECDDLAPNAIDGNPATYWDCDYYASAVPTTKPGFGLLLTLTAEQTVTAVGLQVPNAGATVKIMVPNSDRVGKGDAPPRDSVESWHEVGGGKIVDSSARFVLTEPTTTKYLLIYTTELADVGNWQFKFVVGEVNVYAQE